MHLDPHHPSSTTKPTGRNTTNHATIFRSVIHPSTAILSTIHAASRKSFEKKKKTQTTICSTRYSSVHCYSPFLLSLHLLVFVCTLKAPVPRFDVSFVFLPSDFSLSM
jgi:hypothetical protein